MALSLIRPFSCAMESVITSLRGKVTEATPISTLRRSLTSWVWQSRGRGRRGEGVWEESMFLISPSQSRYNWSNASLPASVRYGGSFWPGGLEGWRVWQEKRKSQTRTECHWAGKLTLTPEPFNVLPLSGLVYQCFSKAMCKCLHVSNFPLELQKFLIFFVPACECWPSVKCKASFWDSLFACGDTHKTP